MKRKIPQRVESSFYQNPTLELCPHGLQVSKPKCLVRKHGLHLVNHDWKRGKQTTFSRASARLLREKLVRMPSIEMGYNSYGVTLTLQKDAFFSASDDYIEYFRKFWKAFRVRLFDNAKKDRFSDDFFLVWRIELTKNRVPHFHTIVYTRSYKDVIYFGDLWLKAVKKWYNIEPIRNVAIDIKEISNFEGAYKYIASHASKHKKDQLGWNGRQWGVIFPKKIAKDILTNISSYDNMALNSVGKCKLCKFVSISFKSYWSILRILRKIYKNNYLVSLKTHFLTSNSSEKIMRFAME